MKNFSLIIFSVILLLFACKKYEEDDCIHFRTVHQRATGTWEIEQYTVDGVDSTNFFNYLLELENKKVYKGDITYYGKVYNNNYEIDVYWSIHDYNKNLEFYLPNSQTSSIPSFISTYSIIKLTNDDFWLINDVTKEKWLKLKKISKK